MDINDVELKMMKAVDTMDSRLLNIRAGRANPAMLNGINADYYGTPTPIQSLANITVPEARQLMIKPFDNIVLSVFIFKLLPSFVGNVIHVLDGQIFRLQIYLLKIVPIYSQL